MSENVNYETQLKSIINGSTDEILNSKINSNAGRQAIYKDDACHLCGIRVWRFLSSMINDIQAQKL